MTKPKSAALLLLFLFLYPDFALLSAFPAPQSLPARSISSHLTNDPGAPPSLKDQRQGPRQRRVPTSQPPFLPTTEPTYSVLRGSTATSKRKHFQVSSSAFSSYRSSNPSTVPQHSIHFHRQHRYPAPPRSTAFPFRTLYESTAKDITSQHAQHMQMSSELGEW